MKEFLISACQTGRYLLGGRRHVLVVWFNRGPVKTNWGDKLNPWLVERLADRPVLNASGVRTSASDQTYAVIGSYMGWRGHPPGVKAWGGGFLESTGQPQVRFENIHAVRGPLSAGKLSHLGDVSRLPLGDPALLMPLLYSGVRKKTHRIGIIAHFREHDHPLFQSLGSDPAIKRIDITGGITPVVDEVLSCEVIVSSSLHGVILAHAYGIPAVVISVSDRPLGDGFKFLDYLHSVGLENPGIIACDSHSSLLAAADAARRPKALPDIARLLDACPFLAPAIGAKLRSQIPNAYAWMST